MNSYLSGRPGRAISYVSDDLRWSMTDKGLLNADTPLAPMQLVHGYIEGKHLFTLLVGRHGPSN